MTYYQIENDTFTATMENDGSHIPLTQMLINVGVLVPVEPDRKTIQIVADALEIYEGQDFSEPAARWSAAVDVLAALGIGDNDATSGLAGVDMLKANIEDNLCPTCGHLHYGTGHVGVGIGGNDET